MIQTIKQKMHGSVLVFTLLALSVLLLGALSLATSTIVGQKNARNTDSSMQSFQTADSGAERVLAAINNNRGGKIADLTTDTSLSCADGIISGNLRGGDSTFSIQLYSDDEGTKLTSCANDDINDIREIKSTGEFAGTTRAIKTAVAAGACGAGVGITMVRESSDENWGQNDFDAVAEFISNSGEGGRIVSMSCVSTEPAGDVTEQVGVDYVLMRGDAAGGDGVSFTGSGGSIGCSGANDCRGFSNNQCDKGWRVLGECP